MATRRVEIKFVADALLSFANTHVKMVARGKKNNKGPL